MKRIFISYRRSDFYQAKSLSEYLQIEFGYDNIFLDRKKINAGDNWPVALREELNKADIMLLIMGPDWLYLQDPLSGKRRIDMKNDWVRQEIIAFLSRMKTNHKLILLPVLIKNAKLPEISYLDSDISKICKLQYIQLDETIDNTDFAEIKNSLQKHGMQSLSLPPVLTPSGLKAPGQLPKRIENKFLKDYPEWKIIVSDKPASSKEYMRELYRHFEFDNFNDAWKFMSKVKEHVIMPLNHHPKWQNNYGRVEIWLSTANIGHDLTKRDIGFAEHVEMVAREYFKMIQPNQLKTKSKKDKKLN